MNRLFFKMLVAFLACMAAMEAQAYDFLEGGIYYKITSASGNTVEVTFKDNSYNYYSGTVTIPTTVTHSGTTYTVTGIGASAFRKSPDLNYVNIPNSVTYYGYGAFYECTSLKTISIPSSVTSIGEYCFMRCSALEDVIFFYGITSIPRQCFTYCESLKRVTLPTSVKEIGYFAFAFCTAMTNVELGQVEKIMYGAFESCASLTTVYIPPTVTSIDEAVFGSCTSMTAFDVNGSNMHYCSQDGVLFTRDMDTLLCYPVMRPQPYYNIPSGVKVIGTQAFTECRNLTFVNVPYGVTTIGDIAFFQSSLETIQVPSTTTFIGQAAFVACENLIDISVDNGNTTFMSDDGVLYTIDGTKLIQYPCARPDKHYSVLNTTTVIADRAFAYTNQLKSVYLPQSLRSLEYQPFIYSSVERVVIDEGLEEIPNNAFVDCEQLQSLYLPSTVSAIGQQAFLYTFGLKEVTCAGTTPPTLGDNAFMYAGYNNDEVILYVPEGVSSNYEGVDDWSFATLYECDPLSTGASFTVDSLKYIVLYDNFNVEMDDVTSTSLIDPGIPPKVAYQGNLFTVSLLGDHALAYCTRMKRVEVPFTVQNIENYGVYGSTSVEKLILRDGIKQIGGFAFSHINQLTRVDIPASVDSIRGDAFTYDPMLREINVASTNTKYTSVDGILFSKDRKRLMAFADGHGPNYTVPMGTQVIDVEAFRGASALTSVIVPLGLKRIERLAFFDCSALTAIELPSTLTSLGYSVFNNAPLTTLTVKAMTPPTCETHLEPHSGTVSEPFTSSHYSGCTLIVPYGCKSAYQSAAVWKKFTNIVEAEMPVEHIRGDVNGDNEVNISDVTALINYLLTDDASLIHLDAADANEDGYVNISDVTVLINYLLTDAWPEPEDIDMWYLWGNFFGSHIWGTETGDAALGVSVLPMYPDGKFNSQGKGTLTWSGYVPRGYFTILHEPGDLSEAWVVDSQGHYVVHSIEDDDPAYSTFLLDAGFYTITLDTKTMTLSFEPYLMEGYFFDSITMPGYYNNWDNSLNAMTPVNTGSLSMENHDWYVAEWTLTNDASYYGELKFCAYDNWDYNWGAEGFPYGQGVQGGMNIPAKAGTYIVFFNDLTGHYNFIAK
ncbi:MAG: leucine-rich repeat protein [Muribaculaceae bacterium]|nr:leucine-rich repeat protein [Muribaculaceae bacterium]